MASLLFWIYFLRIPLHRGRDSFSHHPMVRVEGGKQHSPVPGESLQHSFPMVRETTFEKRVSPPDRGFLIFLITLSYSFLLFINLIALLELYSVKALLFNAFNLSLSNCKV